MKPALIRCVAIDDEPLALEVIEKFCARMGGVEVTTFTDPREALDFMAGCAPDIAFLDIEMGNVSGLTVAASLPASTCVVFTTAYLHYAAEGFNLDAVDYLHKPFSYSRFETAFAKALRRVEYNRSTPRQQSITVKQEYSNVTIPLDDIIYIEASMPTKSCRLWPAGSLAAEHAVLHYKRGGEYCCAGDYPCYGVD